MGTLHREHDATILELQSDYASLDQVGLADFGGQLLSEATYAEPPYLILDLSQTQFIGSAFLELLVRAWKRVRQRGGAILLCGLQPLCRQVLETSRLYDLWPSFPTRDEALKAVAELRATSGG